MEMLVFLALIINTIIHNIKIVKIAQEANLQIQLLSYVNALQVYFGQVYNVLVVIIHNILI
jgi:hypothetical protein